ncbi:class I SAM-dependent RNA methyltransferase [Rhodobacter sp. Har01]|uniref:class I SAM-dependent RNA methyltransferase n=1 Tax=Rhodobacter sp. Har01 TaxID=2883999 RepID=UPI001D06F28A|nr:class I SAM-dependent RNA methyltransferase [Rhodobacter sp. Har01]MCB6178020.1 class I SAM-dependent RNA methyltransferase [Rhodobacter sp. Har01]
MRIVVERLGHLGDGVAAGPVYAEGLLPGEEAEGTLVGDRLQGVRIVTPSPDRVRPPCAHARTCGGCQLQHVADGFLADWKQGVVVQALAQQGLAAPVRGRVETSPPATRRRATLSGRRTKGGVLLGFHAKASDMVVPVPQCRLLHPDLMAGLPAFEAVVALGGSRTGEVQLTVTRSLTGLDVAVTGGKPADSALYMDLARLAERFGLARLTWDDETVALRAEPQVQVGPARVALPPGAFLQATEAGEAALVAAVTDAVGPARRVADLFCGLGTFALPLAATAEVRAVEGDAALTAALDRAARTTAGLRKLTVETRDLFRRPLEPDELKGLDAVVIDPPRAGAEAQAERLAKSAVPVIAMVSCNPASFARDARTLADGGYRLDWVQVVDQFRWSVHVELAARFSRK